MCLRLRLCPKAAVYTLEYKGWGRDGRNRRIYLEWLSCDGITMVQILLTFILTLSVASANIMSLQQAPKERITSFTSHHVHPPTTLPTHRLPTSPALQHSNLPKSVKYDEAGTQAGTWEWSVDKERAVANGRNSAN